MADPAGVARAEIELSAAGNRFMGMTFKSIAAALKAVAGPSFDDSLFVARVGNIQLNRIGATNDAGDTVNDLLRIAVGGVYQEASFQIAAPSDRFRVVLGFKLTLYSIANDTDDVGGFLIPEGVTQQIIARALMRLDRSRGRQVTSRTWQFSTGADNSRFQTENTPGTFALAIAQPRIPSENEILPQSFGGGLQSPVDAINPKDKMNVSLVGLNGIAVAGGYVQDIGVAVDAICYDAVMSGQ
jgi:hypothetical protein